MSKARNVSKGSYVVSRSKYGRNVEVRVVGFKRSIINGFQEDMKEIYESERPNKKSGKVTDANKRR